MVRCSPARIIDPVIEILGSYQENVPKFLAVETGLIVESLTDNLSK